MIRSVDSPHYHVWTDALYARSLARSAKNDWDLGSHVRWCVQSAWTAFEMAAEDALDGAGLGYSFKACIDDQVASLGLPKINWGQGTWQAVTRVHGQRITYVHNVKSQEDLFPDLAVGEDAIVTLRAAVKAVYSLAGRPQPDWVDDDGVVDPPDVMGFLTAFRDGMNPNDPNPNPDRIRVTYIYRDVEHEVYVCGPRTDPLPWMHKVLKDTIVPISVVRAYRGDDLLEEWKVNMRGTPRAI